MQTEPNQRLNKPTPQGNQPDPTDEALGLTGRGSKTGFPENTGHVQDKKRKTENVKQKPEDK